MTPELTNLFASSCDGPVPWLQLAGDPRFRLCRLSLPVKGLPLSLHRFTLLYLTDVHVRTRWEPVFDSLLTALQTEPYRLVLFGGDLVEDRRDARPALPFVRRLLDALTRQAKVPMVAVLGNHDPSKLPVLLRDAPLRFLECERALVEPGIEVIGLVGPHPVLSDRFLKRLPPVQPGVPRLVMGHYPFHLLQAGPILKPDLYLAGHTHGGQVCLPGGRPLITHDRLPKKYSAGLHLLPYSGGEGGQGATPLLVSRGLGFSSFQVRVLCPPEAHLISLVPSTDPATQA